MEVIDPRGYPVVLSDERWRHIVERHPEVELEDLVLALREPSIRITLRRPHQWGYYLHGHGPSEYLKVVVSYDRYPPWVVTAYPRRSFP